MYLYLEIENLRLYCNGYVGTICNIYFAPFKYAAVDNKA
jgi:hypothetical protein